MSPFTTLLLISLFFFDFPFPSKHITLLVRQLSPKRLQASFLNNRSNQLPSPSLCAPLLHTLFQQRVQREDNFSKQQRWGGKWQRGEKGGTERDKGRERDCWLARSRWFKESRGTSDNTTQHADVCCLKLRHANAQLLCNPWYRSSKP